VSRALDDRLGRHQGDVNRNTAARRLQEREKRNRKNYGGRGGGRPHISSSKDPSIRIPNIRPRRTPVGTKGLGGKKAIKVLPVKGVFEIVSLEETKGVHWKRQAEKRFGITILELEKALRF